MEHNIFLTDKAKENITKQLLKRNMPDAYIRLGIKGSGCSGYLPIIKFEDTPPKVNDLMFKFDDINVAVDPKSILYLNNTTLDWEQTLMASGFKFNFPQNIKYCGCGKSFAI